jgi:uncharacterized delta-60 repeat protein
MKKVKLLIIIMAALLAKTTYAQPGMLDSTFSLDGKIMSLFLPYCNYANSLAIQPDGKIVIAGYSKYTSSSNSSFTYARYKEDGSLDSSFCNVGWGGFLQDGFPSVLTSVLLQPDGRIILGGHYDGLNNEDFVLICLDTNGAIDSSFSGGVIITDFGHSDYSNALAMQPDGKIIAAGYSMGPYKAALARYNTNGSLDTTGFGTGGKVLTGFSSLEAKIYTIDIQTDGKIIVAGYIKPSISSGNRDFLILRYNTDGTSDSTFGIDGRVSTEFFGYSDVINAAVIQPDGKIVTAGYAENGLGNAFIALIRYNSDGTLDNSFGTNGKVTTLYGAANWGSGLALQPDGKILVVGSSFFPTDNFCLVRYNINGILDNSFGTGGIAHTDFLGHNDGAYAVALQPDGKIVAAGFASNSTSVDSTYIALARYISDLIVGVIDFSVSENSVLIYPNPIEQNSTLEYTLAKEEIITIQLYDVHGKLVSTFLENEKQEAGEHKQSIVLPNTIAPGAYVIVISSPNGRMSIKVLKKYD